MTFRCSCLVPEKMPCRAEAEVVVMPPPVLATSMEVLAAIRRMDIDDVYEEGDHFVLSDGVQTRRAFREAVFAAIEREPAIIVPHVGYGIAFAVVEKYPGT